jgi:hypothetical protein
MGIMVDNEARCQCGCLRSEHMAGRCFGSIRGFECECGGFKSPFTPGTLAALRAAHRPSNTSAWENLVLTVEDDE